jgi:hypothetical protein
MARFRRLLRGSLRKLRPAIPADTAGRAAPATASTAEPSAPPLPYSWILTNELAIGPMPAVSAHWRQLEDAGFRSRFSCCYPEEEAFSPVPSHWRSDSLALPDHRQQERLRPDRLLAAIDAAEALILERGPLYLHCFAGRERSPIVAIGLTARRRSIDVFAAIDWVRRCHPPAAPIYEQLDILEQLLRSGNSLR